MTTQDVRVSAFTLRASAGSTRQSTLTWRDAGGADYPIDDHELTVLVDGDEMDVELDGNVATVTWVFPDELGPVPLQILLDGVPQTSGQVVLSRLGTDLFVGDVDVVVAPLSFTVEVVGGGVSQSDLNSVVVDLADEATARAGADFNLGQSIASEASTRAAADSALSSAISSEASTRATADGTLTTNLAAEVAARTALGASLPVTYVPRAQANVLTVGPAGSGADYLVTDYASPDLAVQTAVSSLAAGFFGGGEIRLMSGTYDFVGGVVPPSTRHNIKIGGAGLSTIVRWKNGNTFANPTANSNWLFTTTSFFIVTDVHLIGQSTFACPINGSNTFNAGAGSNTLGGGLCITDSRTWVDRIYITGFAEDGITNLGGRTVKYGEVEIIGCGGVGLNITNTPNSATSYATDGDLSSVWVGSCGTGMVVAEGGTLVLGAHVWGCQLDGIRLDANFVRIVGGYFETCGRWGVNLNGHSYCVVTDNDVWGNGLAFTDSSTAYGGVGSSAGSAHHNTVTANILRDNRFHQVLLAGAASENNVGDNVMSDSFSRNQSTLAAVTYTASASEPTTTAFTDANAPAWMATANTAMGLTVVITGAGAAGAILTTQVVGWVSPTQVTLQNAMSTATVNPTYSVHAVAYGVRESGTAANNNISNNTIHRLDAQIAQVALNPVANANSTSLGNVGVNAMGWNEISSAGTGTIAPDLRVGGTYHATLTANVTAVTFFPSATNLNRGDILSIALTQGGAGGFTVTGWPANVKWAGFAPIFPTAVGATGVVTLRYDGTNWIELARPVAAVRKVLAADVPITSNTTLAGLGALFFPIAASEAWIFHGMLIVDGGQAGDVKLRVQGTSATGITGYFTTGLLPATSNSSSTAASMGPLNAQTIAASGGTALSGGLVGAGSLQGVTINGYALASSTPGTVDVQAAQLVSDATATTIRAGSWIEATRVA